MESTVCTLFEGNYHYGLGALMNSLYRHGYRGIAWVGYRGELPPWASSLKKHAQWTEFQGASDFILRFIEIKTERHFANYKPEFMLKLWADYCPESLNLFYFDPDIVIKCEWTFFENWVSCGVALCEDVNSPMHSSHPIRCIWRRFCEQKQIFLTRDLDIYVNAGFVGITREHREILDIWKKLLEAHEIESGALDKLLVSSRPFAFYAPDQDMLNVSIMTSSFPVSLVGRDGMDFIHGGYLMSHAIGRMKPWNKPMLRMAFKGIPPSLADKGYWQNVQKPISLYSEASLRLHKLDLALASAVGRFIRRT